MEPRARTILRDLALRVAEIAAWPEQEEKRRRWYAHNGLEHGRPLVYCSPEGSWRELMPETAMEIEEPELRVWESHLRSRIYAALHFKDDQVLDTRLSVGRVATYTGWGADATYTRSDSPRGAYVWDAPLKDLEDLSRLHPPETVVDEEATLRSLSLAQDLFGDILDVQLRNSHWWSLGLIGELALLRGLQQVMVDMCVNPGWLHRAMRFIMEGKLQWIRSLEDRGLLALNNGNDYVGSGSFGFTTELPQPDMVAGRVRTQDMWGFAEAQEISGVSPAMHDEFVLQYQMPILDLFGLNCYGCCEPVDDRFHILRKVPRLRRVSISPFCNVRKSAELLGDKYIYSWKPHPAHLAAVTFDPDFVRNYIRDTLEAARGCIVEIVLKDTHTCNNDPVRFDIWTKIAYEEAERAAERL